MKKLFLLLFIVVLALPACTEAADEIPEMTTPELVDEQGETDEDDEDPPLPPNTGVNS